MMPPIQELIRLTVKTHAVDETGDSSFLQYLIEHPYLPDEPFSKVLDHYLEWANGSNKYTPENLR